jgi:hypothetical protein
MARSIGDAFLGGMTLAQQANQSRFENQYRNRVLDLDNRTLDERTRQFDLAYNLDKGAQTLARGQQQLDRDILAENKRAAKATEQNFAARTGVLQQSADTQDDIQALARDKYGDEVRTDYATQRALQFATEGWLTTDGMDLGDDFFARNQDGRLKNKSEIIDLLDLNSEALISQTGDGQFRDMEVAGFDYDKSSGTTRVLLRGKGTDEPPVPLTDGASSADNEQVVELEEEDLRRFVRSQWSNEIIPRIDSSNVDLSQLRIADLARKSVIASREKQVRATVTALAAKVGNAGFMRDAQAMLVNTADDPEARAELLKSFGIDAAQFETADVAIDPSAEYLGPESPIRDPLSDRPFAPTLSMMAGGRVAPFSNEPGQQTEFANLVSELQQNFQESEDLRTKPSGVFERQTSGAEREVRQSELATRRAELIKNIPSEIANRKVAREAYAKQLNEQRVSQPQVDKALAQYDAYIAQLEEYIPVREAAVVDVAAEFGKLAVAAKSDPRAFADALASGQLNITEDQVAQVRQHLIDQNINSQMDLETADITTKFAALGLAAATSQDTSTRNNVSTALLNALDTGSFTLTKNQELDAQDKSRGRDQTDREFEAERVDTRNELAQANRERVATNVDPVRQALQTSLGLESPRDVSGMSEAQINASERLYASRQPLRERVSQLWAGGAGQDAFDGARDRNKSAAERQEFNGVFRSATVASIQALIARKPNSGFSTEDNLRIRDIRTSAVDYSQLEIELDGENLPKRFRFKNPEGGVYRNGITPADLKREMGDAPYRLFLQQLEDEGRLKDEGALETQN